MKMPAIAIIMGTVASASADVNVPAAAFGSAYFRSEEQRLLQTTPEAKKRAHENFMRFVEPAEKPNTDRNEKRIDKGPQQKSN